MSNSVIGENCFILTITIIVLRHEETFYIVNKGNDTDLMLPYQHVIRSRSIRIFDLLNFLSRILVLKFDFIRVGSNELILYRLIIFIANTFGRGKKEYEENKKMEI